MFAQCVMLFVCVNITGKQAEFKLVMRRGRDALWDVKNETHSQSNALISIFSDSRLYSLVSNVFLW